MLTAIKRTLVILVAAALVGGALALLVGAVPAERGLRAGAEGRGRESMGRRGWREHDGSREFGARHARRGAESGEAVSNGDRLARGERGQGGEVGDGDERGGHGRFSVGRGLAGALGTSLQIAVLGGVVVLAQRWRRRSARASQVKASS